MNTVPGLKLASMKDALQLTRAGKLADAVAAIRDGLGGSIQAPTKASARPDARRLPQPLAKPTAGDQRRDGGEPSLSAASTRVVMRELPGAAGQVYGAGRSAGGAAAAIMGQRYPDLYAGVGVHSGLACGAARDVGSAFAAMRGGAAPVEGRPSRVVPTIVFHGTADGTVNPSNAHHVTDQARAGLSHPEVTTGRSEGGVAFTRKVFKDGASRVAVEEWMLEGAGHAWSGGSAAGSYTDPRGPDASREMMRFFGGLAAG